MDKKKNLLKIITLDHIQTVWEGTKLITQQNPWPYTKDGKNNIRYSTRPYHEGNTNNDTTKENNSTKTTNHNINITNNLWFDNNPVVEKNNNNWRCSIQ